MNRAIRCTDIDQPVSNGDRVIDAVVAVEEVVFPERPAGSVATPGGIEGVSCTVEVDGIDDAVRQDGGRVQALGRREPQELARFRIKREEIAPVEVPEECREVHDAVGNRWSSPHFLQRDGPPARRARRLSAALGGEGYYIGVVGGDENHAAADDWRDLDGFLRSDRACPQDGSRAGIERVELRVGGRVDHAIRDRYTGISSCVGAP